MAQNFCKNLKKNKKGDFKRGEKEAMVKKQNRKKLSSN